LCLYVISSSFFLVLSSIIAVVSTLNGDRRSPFMSHPLGIAVYSDMNGPENARRRLLVVAEYWGPRLTVYDIESGPNALHVCTFNQPMSSLPVCAATARFGRVFLGRRCRI
jgi:hypothetical protein